MRSWGTYIAYFHPYLFTWNEDEFIGTYFGTTKQGENFFLIWIASVFPQILLTASAPAAEPVALLRPSGNGAAWQSYLDLNFDIFRLWFCYVLFKAFECYLQRPTVIISSRDIRWKSASLTLWPMANVNFTCCYFCSTVSCVFRFVNGKSLGAEPW